MPVTVTLELPEDLAVTLGLSAQALSRAALEALAVEGYRTGRLSDAQFRRMLGLTRFEADALLRDRGIWLDYSVEDFNREGDG